MNLIDMLRPVNHTCECYLQLEEMLNRRTGCLEEIEGFPRLKSLVWDWFEIMMGLGGCGQCSVWADWELEVLVLQKGWWGMSLQNSSKAKTQDWLQTPLAQGPCQQLRASPCPRSTTMLPNGLQEKGEWYKSIAVDIYVYIDGHKTWFFLCFPATGQF